MHWSIDNFSTSLMALTVVRQSWTEGTVLTTTYATHPSDYCFKVVFIYWLYIYMVIYIYWLHIVCIYWLPKIKCSGFVFLSLISLQNLYWAVQASFSGNRMKNCNLMVGLLTIFTRHKYLKHFCSLHYIAIEWNWK